MPLNQQIESSDCAGQAGLKISRYPMHDFLKVANHGQHGEHCLNNHALIPRFPTTQLEIVWIARLGMKSGIAQHDHALLEDLDQGMKQRVVGVIANPIKDRTYS